MQRLSRFLKNKWEVFIVSIFILVMAIANFWHVIWYFLVRPQNSVFIGITHYYEDYFYYISLVKEGQLGNWLTRNLYTTEAIPPAPLWLLNIVIGKIGGLLGLNAWTSYDIAVFALSILWLITSYWVIKKLVPDNSLLRISAFLIATTASPYYLLQKNANGQLFVNPYLYFYNYTSAFNRLGGVAHLILQNILSLLVIFIAGKLIGGIYSKSHHRKQFIRQTFLLAILLTSLLFINPSYVLVDAIAIVLVAVGYLVKKPTLKSLSNYLFIALVSGSFLTVSYLIVADVFSHPFYLYFRVLENSIQPTIPNIFFHSIGIILPLMLIGLLPYLKKRDPLLILGAIYSVIPIFLFFSDIPGKLGIPYFRLHQPPAYVFFGIAAAEGVWLVAQLLGKLLPGRPREALVLLGTSAFIVFHLPMLHYELTSRMNGYWLTGWPNSIDKKTFSGIEALGQLPRDKTVLAFNTLETVIPALTGHTVYVGHSTLTYDYPRKIAQAYQFFNTQMNEDSARHFLAENNIGYILWLTRDGPERLEEKYPFLTKSFENGNITIYMYVFTSP